VFVFVVGIVIRSSHCIRISSRIDISIISLRIRTYMYISMTMRIRMCMIVHVSNPGRIRTLIRISNRIVISIGIAVYHCCC